MRLTEQVHHTLKQCLLPGDYAIDATTGNGHDTLFLAQCVGEKGHVFAFDVQQQALQHAQQHVRHELTPITWLHTSHANMQTSIPLAYHGKIKAISFNLGYLPQADKAIITTAESTIPALEQSIQLLCQGGVISILAYTAHQGGRQEAEAVKTWVKSLSTAYEVNIKIPQGTKNSPPEWIYIHKNAKLRA